MNALGPLYKKYKFSNFIKAMEFANKITEIAEQAA
ncbi:putative pterin-4-alpha-carbinolamine dehydratase (PHS) [Rickettsia rickettsii str. Arizona]|uniref:Pterin-4-alpha-carbinolamine dehydratase n=2 Tax=Rickettsia rickettsii TaxID=783 RepID=B0BWQ4_RICRO|nr:Putative pterin-4-alpha-carbinolamine dehydratase (PHS) [Rickettsia rickettsii str. 'Sheila Smith']ABY72280.1 pterin-4-alpha-carbinolamine dehydratase [Rickettsia rickettsii str. Iowa]AFB22504.1 putative pterin-4-alpha-carbinolamine dehydratase (PHS) [Rickettsia rickettsii str. Brazil]AFB23260.1 putative pterin-4-alpha-carbinolamine dehydratase (PHS) [Rickettsia rickettsii str. Colombia]AFB24612.1 putative pterin-4-alpha-carbinolamine dehydratase (PHS) [Rickettsia rickettsii str. Arizona]AF